MDLGNAHVLWKQQRFLPGVIAFLINIYISCVVVLSNKECIYIYIYICPLSIVAVNAKASRVAVCAYCVVAEVNFPSPS